MSALTAELCNHSSTGLLNEPLEEWNDVLFPKPSGLGPKMW